MAEDKHGGKRGQTAESGNNQGGKGGNGFCRRGTNYDSGKLAGGGAGNKGGYGWNALNSLNGTIAKDNDAMNGENGTGGLLVIYAHSIYNNGIVASNGSKGGSVNTGDHNMNGGSSGGGAINIFYKNSFVGKDNCTAKGGEKVENGYGAGGAGGDGSITIGNISTGTFVENTENIKNE